MSSQEVIKSVSRKLKHYFEVKRLEDGFDLSGPKSPQLDHPPLRTRATLQYDGLHDKPVKHYFSPHDVRVQLTQMKCPEGKEAREDQIKNLVAKYMDNSQFVHPSMPEYSYYHTPRGRKLRPEYQGHGTFRKVKKPFRGGYPLLRSVTPHYLSKGEAVRLVNVATKLLLATETVDMKSGKPSRASSASGGSQSLPRLKGKPRPATAKYTYDLDGRRVKPERKSKDDSYLMEDADSAYSTNQTTSPTNEYGPNRPMPAWLKREIQKLERENAQQQSVRPRSGSRESSASGSRPRSGRPASGRRARPLSAKGQKKRSESMEDPLIESGGQTSEDACVQTDSALMNQYTQMDRIVNSGEKAKYRVYVRTGNKLGASTSADVFITIYGTKGRTEEILLHESKNHKVKFVKGQEDEFHFSYYHVGEVKKIRIGHNRTELGSGWFLETVTVNDLLDRNSYRFRCERWLSYRDEDGKTKKNFEVDTIRNLPPDSELTESETDASAHSYVSRSRTSSESSDSENNAETSRTSVAAQPSQRAMNGREKEYSSDSSTLTSSSDQESETEKSVDVSSPKDTQSKDDKPVTAEAAASVQTPSSESVGDTFSSDKPEVSERSEKSKDMASDDSQSEIAVVRPAEPTLVVKEQGGVKKGDEKSQDDLFMEGYKAGVEAAKRSEAEKARHLEEEQQKLTQGACIHEASKQGDLRRVIVLINHNPELINAKDERGSTALHLAAASGHIELVKWLAINCADLNAEAPTGYTPVHFAALNGHTNSVMVLSAMGASIDLKSIDQQTPLHLAAMSGHFGTCKWLVGNDADLEAEDNMDRTPLDLADEYRHHELAEFLRKRLKIKQMSGMATIAEERKESTERVDYGKSNHDEEKEEEYKAQTQRSDDTESTPRIDPDSDATENSGGQQVQEKKEQELQEKRKVYAQQQKKMVTKHKSFLDSIRDDAMDDDEYI